MGRKTKSERLRNWWNSSLKELYGAVPEHQQFVLSSGESLKDLKDLVVALPNMSEEVFSHHVNEHKNDFASWVHDVLDERALAEELGSAENKLQAELAVAKHLNSKLESLSERLVKRA